MPDSYYPEPDAGEMTPPPEDNKPESQGQSSALIPKSLLGGKTFNVGDEIVLKIVHEYEDEVEVEYASEKPPEKEQSANDEIDEAASERNAYA